jgi:hypothetical protein
MFGTAFAHREFGFPARSACGAAKRLDGNPLAPPAEIDGELGGAGAGFRYLSFAQKSDPVSECLTIRRDQDSAAEAATQ